MRMSKRVVVFGVLGLVLGAAPKTVEAQRVTVRAKAPSVRVNVRVGPPMRVHSPVRVRKVTVTPTHHVRAAALRCDRREDIADAREDRRDRAEDIADAREDRRDARYDGGLRDRLEDVADRAEDRRDRAEDVRDRREDRWDATHVGCRR